MSPQEKRQLKQAISSAKDSWNQERKRLEAALNDSQKVLQEGDPFDMAMHLETVNNFYMQERTAYTQLKETLSATEEVKTQDLHFPTVAISGAA